ncbi:hypothetical protein BDZ85DRAFT_5110 [Elsinoe ampelina]|uniref:Uncharacterized protein n=1 Tax=Elsinoe ampelina TaxID=302913 RepID=A0A6A6GP96_9PEZI|nr:hypothetical protein BDZ85DRAFT_5110 [Elsinoe ampelina]
MDENIDDDHSLADEPTMSLESTGTAGHFETATTVHVSTGTNAGLLPTKLFKLNFDSDALDTPGFAFLPHPSIQAKQSDPGKAAIVKKTMKDLKQKDKARSRSPATETRIACVPAKRKDFRPESHGYDQVHFSPPPTNNAHPRPGKKRKTDTDNDHFSTFMFDFANGLTKAAEDSDSTNDSQALNEVPTVGALRADGSVVLDHVKDCPNSNQQRTNEPLTSMSVDGETTWPGAGQDAIAAVNQSAAVSSSRGSSLPSCEDTDQASPSMNVIAPSIENDPQHDMTVSNVTSSEKSHERCSMPKDQPAALGRPIPQQIQRDTRSEYDDTAVDDSSEIDSTVHDANRGATSFSGIDEDIVKLASLDIDDLEQSIAQMNFPAFERDFLANMDLWKGQIMAWAKEKLAHYATHSQKLSKQNLRMQKQFQEIVKQENELRAQLATAEATLSGLGQENVSLSEDLLDQKTALADAHSILSECQKRLMEAQAASIDLAQYIDGLDAELIKFPAHLEHVQGQHAKALFALTKQLQDVTRDKGMVESELQNRTTEATQAREMIEQLKPDWVQLNGVLEELRKSFTSKLDDAFAKATSTERQATLEELAQMSNKFNTIERLGGAFREDLTRQLPQLRSIQKDVTELLARPVPQDPPAPLAVDDLVDKIKTLLNSVDSTMAQSFSPVAEHVKKLTENTAALSTMTEALRLKDTELKSHLGQIQDLQSHLTIASGDLQVTIQEKQFLQKENLRLTNENVSVKTEAATHRAGLADWKAEAALKQRLVESAESLLSEARKETEALQNKVEALQQAVDRNPAHEPAVNVSAIRREIQDEFCRLIIQKDRDVQRLQDDQHRSHTTEVHSLKSQVTVLKESHEGIQSKQSHTQNLYDTLAIDYKILTNERDRLQQAIGKAEAAKASANKLATKAAQDLALLRDEHRKLQSDHQSVLNEIVCVRKQLTTNGSACESSTLQQRITELESEAAAGKEASSKEIERLVQKCIELESYLEKMKHGMSKDQALVIDDTGDQDEHDDDVDGDDFEEEGDIEVQRSGTVGPNRPMTPQKDHRPSSAVANSGIKRQISSQHSLFDGDFSLSQGSPVDASAGNEASRKVTGEAHSCPKDLGETELSQDLTFNIGSYSQHNPATSSFEPSSAFQPSQIRPTESGDKPGQLPKINKRPALPVRNGGSSKPNSPDKPSKNTRRKSAVPIKTGTPLSGTSLSRPNFELGFASASRQPRRRHNDDPKYAQTFDKALNK